MTIKYLPHGLNEENVILVEDTIAGPIADDAAFSITVPDLIGKGAKPLAVLAATQAGGDVGARVWTPRPLCADGGTGVALTSYTEATGVLAMTNESGGSLSNIHVTALFVLAGAV